MQLKRLRLKDRALFERYLVSGRNTLAAYSFANIFIWQGLYDIFWTRIENNLSVFFRDKIGCFLYLPPQGKQKNKIAIHRSFQILNQYNTNRAVSRIENIPDSQVHFYRRLGYKVVLGSRDYICRRNRLADLTGGYLKKKRAAANTFEHKYDFRYRPYRSADKKECLALFKFWATGRKRKYSDAIYQRLLDDNFAIFKVALKHFSALGFLGRVVCVGQRIKAITLGYYLNDKTFVILFEICDLSFRGIAQYIFRRLCQDLNCAYVNIMDDCGLANLRQAKLSYQPVKTENNFVASYE